MFFNSNDPRTQLQARLNSESRAQHSNDRSCDESTFAPASNDADRTAQSTRLFGARSTRPSNSALGKSPARSAS
jgi:hypothetical protein